MLNNVDNLNLLQSGSGAITASGTDTYTASVTPSLTAYVNGQPFLVKFTNANTGASTLNIDTLGAKNIQKNGSIALTKGDIQAGQSYWLFYDGTNIQLVGKTYSEGVLYRAGSTGSFIPGYSGTAGTYSYIGGLETSVHLGIGINDIATRVFSFILPDNFLEFKEIQVGTYRFGNVDSFTVTLVKIPAFPHTASTAGTNDATLVTQDVLPTANDTHERFSFVPTGTYSGEDGVSIEFTSQVDSGEYAEVSFVELHFYTK